MSMSSVSSASASAASAVSTQQHQDQQVASFLTDPSTLPSVLPSGLDTNDLVKARDTLVVWKKIAETLRSDGSPVFTSLSTFQDVITKARDFRSWLVRVEFPDQGRIPPHYFDESFLLDLSGLKLSTLPEELKSNIDEVRTLDLSDNLFTQLPECIAYTNLFSLFLSNNQLTEMPPQIKDLSLSRLYIDNNQLTALPTWLPRYNDDLMELRLNGNSITHTPPAVQRWLQGKGF